VKDLSGDIRFALRQFARHPGFTACTVLTLALGIGVNTAIFSVVNGVLLRPLPYTQGDGLVHLGKPSVETEEEDRVDFSVPELQDVAAQSRTIQDLAEFHAMPFTLLGRGEPDRVQIGVVSANYFDLFGVRPLLGRAFVPTDDDHGAEPVLVLTHQYWRSRFGGDPAIIGHSLRLNDRPITIVGVLPPLPQYPNEADAYMPTVACPTRSNERFASNRRARILTSFARLAPGATVEEARTEMAALAARMRQANPGDYEGETESGIPLLSVREELTGEFRPLLLVLMGAVGLVLLVACANVANLILARLASREQELGVRTAFGAGRSRLARQLLTESTLLALAGGALAVLLATSGVSLLVAFAGRFTARTNDIGIDGPVLLFTAGLALLTGVAVGVAPALRTAPRRLAATLRAGGRQSSASRARLRLRGVMVIAQVAVSFVLLTGAGLLLRTFINLQRVDPGFEPANVMLMEVPLPFSRYPERAQRLDFFDRLFGSLHELPGVRSAAVAGDLPLSEDPFAPAVRIEGRELAAEGESQAAFNIVSDDYFRTLAIPLFQGRSFAASDRGEEALPVAIVNRAMARLFWPGESPVGRRFEVPSQMPGRLWTVVGVVGDVKYQGLDTEGGPAFYLPFSQFPGGGLVFVRASSVSGNLLRDARSLVRRLDPEQPVVKMRTLEQVQDEWIAPSRLTAVLVGLFAVLAAVIAALGIGSVVAFAVAERTHEIGIRAALGATPRQLLGLVVQRTLPLLVVGLVLGVVGSLWLNRLMSNLLFGVEPGDPTNLAVVALGFAVVFVIAALLPARRATRIDPLLALKW
jgi:predicted permease